MCMSNFPGQMRKEEYNHNRCMHKTLAHTAQVITHLKWPISCTCCQNIPSSFVRCGHFKGTLTFEKSPRVLKSQMRSWYQFHLCVFITVQHFTTTPNQLYLHAASYVEYVKHVEVNELFHDQQQLGAVTVRRRAVTFYSKFKLLFKPGEKKTLK